MSPTDAGDGNIERLSRLLDAHAAAEVAEFDNLGPASIESGEPAEGVIDEDLAQAMGDETA